MHHHFRSPVFCRSAALACVALVLASRAGAAVDAIVTVAEDATAYASAPDVTHGDETELRSGAGIRAFLQFRLPPLGDGVIVSATLIGDARRPYPVSPVRFHDISLVADDAWSESTLTWNAQPGIAPAPLAQIDITQVGSSAPITLDVSAPAQAAQADDGRLSLRIAPAAGAVGNDVRFVAYDPAYGETSGFRLELVFDRRPHARAGDLLRIETDSDVAPFAGVIAADPETFVRKHVASMVFPRWVRDLARDPADGSLLALDRAWDGSARLLRFDAATGSPSIVSAAGSLSWYSSFIVDPAGDFYATGVAAPPPATIVRIDRETGIQQVVWTDTSADGASGVTALAAGLDGSLLVARSVEWWTSEIVRVDPTTGLESAVTTLPVVAGMAVAGDGALWVVAWDEVAGSRSQLIRVDLESGVQTNFGPTQERAESVVPEPGGTLLILAQRDPAQAAPGGGYVDRFDPATGSYSRLLHDDPSSIGGVVLEPDGSWTAAWTTEEGVRISRHDSATYEETVFAAPLGPTWIESIAVDRARRLLVVPGTGWRIVEVDLLTGAQRLVTSEPSILWGSGPMKQLKGVAIGPDERLFTVEVEDGATARLQEIDRSTGARTDLATFDGFHAAITAAQDGDVLVAPTTYPPYVSSITRVDPDTGAQTSVSSGEFLQLPYVLAVDPVSSSLLVSDAAADQLFRVDLETGEEQVVASTPWLAFVDGLGGAFVSGPWRRIDLATGESTPQRVSGAAMLRARCSDGFDNDRDGAGDWPEDPECLAPTQDREGAPSCGLGTEIALALSLVGRVGSRTRRICGSAHGTAKSSDGVESAT